PEWSGIASGCSHPHANPHRDLMHTVERQAEQLAMAGIVATPQADLAWVQADVARFGLATPYALLVPGGSKHRPAKRWPVSRYGEIAAHVKAKGVSPVVLGGPDEADLVRRIPGAIDLTGKTGFGDIVVLARGAKVAIGNDTGPMHLIAAAGCPAIVVFAAESDPALCAPRGRAVTVIRRATLAGLATEEVMALLPA
ncbi:MAG: glycosyltransferase family 9 protein, partial [Alphaproteobacteria bacterium]|nr:glycosyltransferase family 9 protein [Alphaproteobacteria bacterium]